MILILTIFIYSYSKLYITHIRLFMNPYNFYMYPTYLFSFCQLLKLYNTQTHEYNIIYRILLCKVFALDFRFIEPKYFK